MKSEQQYVEAQRADWLVTQDPETLTRTHVDRRSVLQWMAASAALMVSPESHAAKSKPMNFVYIIMDDMGWADLGSYGNKVIDTPNLDRLASQGARFTNAYASCPVCSPSRASVMTGQHPARIGLTDFIPGTRNRPTAKLIQPTFVQQLPLSCTTLAELLAGQGYRTANIGKWHLGGDGYLPTNQGFQLNIAGDDRGHPKSYFGPEEFENMTLAPDESLTERLGAESAKYLGVKGNAPFFLYAGHYAVHGPIQARPEEVAKYRQRDTGEIDPIYCAMVESVDRAVKAVLDVIDQSGAAGNTVVIFTSDHGGLRYEGKSPKPVTTNAPLRAGKGHVYEGGIRIPLLVRWPGVTKPGSVIDTPVMNVDWFPTISGALGVKPKDVMDGVDILPVLRAKSNPERPFYWHYPHYSPQGGSPAGAVRLGDWKLIEFFEDNRLELYNLAEDIGERRNLVRKEPARAASLFAMLKDWRVRVDAKMPTQNPRYNPAKADRGFTGEEPPTAPV